MYLFLSKTILSEIKRQVIICQKKSGSATCQLFSRQEIRTYTEIVSISRATEIFTFNVDKK